MKCYLEDEDIEAVVAEVTRCEGLDQGELLKAYCHTVEKYERIHTPIVPLMNTILTMKANQKADREADREADRWESREQDLKAHEQAELIAKLEDEAVRREGQIDNLKSEVVGLATEVCEKEGEIIGVNIANEQVSKACGYFYQEVACLTLMLDQSRKRIASMQERLLKLELGGSAVAD